MKIVGTESLAYASNSDVVGNRFYHLSDDGVVTDGYASNVRIANNRFEYLLAGVSVALAEAGPVYVIRNLMIDLQNVAFTDFEATAMKFNMDGELSGEIFAYHNTGVTYEPRQAGISVTNDSNWQNLTLANNIWQGTLQGMYYFLDNSLPLNQDYDLIQSASTVLVFFQDVDYTSIGSYASATGHCVNCIAGDPSFVDGSGGNYELRASSPAIDSAVVIPGINDTGFACVAPDVGAFERRN